MKNKIKNEINDLLGNKGSKQDLLVVSNPESGKYVFRDKTYTEKEFKELQKGYLKTVTFVPAKTKIQKT